MKTFCESIGFSRRLFGFATSEPDLFLIINAIPRREDIPSPGRLDLVLTQIHGFIKLAF
ncbi:unnamed protein product [Tenebrio molitor]|nr:unnamed protein product [Tenebrio molitor]